MRWAAGVKEELLVCPHVRGTPKARDLFITTCVCILTRLNLGHLQSTRRLGQYNMPIETLSPRLRAVSEVINFGDF